MRNALCTISKEGTYLNEDTQLLIGTTSRLILDGGKVYIASQQPENTQSTNELNAVYLVASLEDA